MPKIARGLIDSIRDRYLSHRIERLRVPAALGWLQAEIELMESRLWRTTRP